jgi:hypothetical protein
LTEKELEAVTGGMTRSVPIRGYGDRNIRRCKHALGCDDQPVNGAVDYSHYALRAGQKAWEDREAKLTQRER